MDALAPLLAAAIFAQTAPPASTRDGGGTAPLARQILAQDATTTLVLVGSLGTWAEARLELCHLEACVPFSCELDEITKTEPSGVAVTGARRWPDHPGWAYAEYKLHDPDNLPSLYKVTLEGAHATCAYIVRPIPPRIMPKQFRMTWLGSGLNRDGLFETRSGWDESKGGRGTVVGCRDCPADRVVTCTWTFESEGLTIRSCDTAAGTPSAPEPGE